MRPALVEMPKQNGPVLRETFAPILYVMRYSRLRGGDRAAQRRVGTGLSSSIFTTRPARGRALHFGRRLGLRHRQCQHRPFGRRDRRRLRRREGDRRRPRSRLRCMEGLYAARRPTRSTTARPCRWRRVSSSKSPSELDPAAASSCRPVSCDLQQFRYHAVDSRADDGTSGSDLIADVDGEASVGSIGDAVELAANEDRQVGGAFTELTPEL